MAIKELTYRITSQIELNLSYMPFIWNGGLFIPTTDSFTLGEQVNLNLELLGENYQLEGKVVWIAPKNGLYHLVQGIGMQLLGSNVKAIRELIESRLDSTMEVGGYAYGTAAQASNK